MADVATLLSVIDAPDRVLGERIAAAHELATLGDPRLAVANQVVIPGGVFAMGAEPRSVHVSSYAIDRYPVTVAAYREFIDAGGYRDERYWSEGGWRWVVDESIEAPRFWGENEWSAYLVSNHPVVGVSFFEAQAYAAFRGARLPTEAEWEKGARGTDGRLYPWGNEWIDDACGTRGVGPRSTVPVGVFPRGVSPLGLFDMVGCLWQWCVDGFEGWGGSPSSDQDPIAPAKAGPAAPRITCGGAWNTLRWSVTCLSRNGYPSSARFSNLGFRCVVSTNR